MALTSEIGLSKYKWTSDKEVHVVGFIWQNGEYVAGKELHNFISKSSRSFNEFKTTVSSLNGQFSVVVQKESETWLLCSHTWSYPVFYLQNSKRISISDDPQILLEQLQNPEIDVFSRSYFLLFGVTPQNATLVKQISQVKAGEIVVLTDIQSRKISVFNVAHKSPAREQGEEELYQTILSLFERYFKYVKNKQVLLPLTRGYDSRLLACLLKEFGHKNVLCATWGRKGNTEVPTAQKVAEKLGFPHVFVEYNSELISGFSKKDVFLDYARFAGHFSSMPFLQDYFAIDYLKRNKIISTETVALPGHSGDYFAGSHLDLSMDNVSSEYLMSKIETQYSSAYPVDSKQLKEIENHITEEFLITKDAKPWQKFEKWDFEERQCKFISNSNQAWSFFGIEVMMPLFDRELIEFFENIPFHMKLGATYYNQTLENRFFIPQKVNFDLKEKQVPKPSVMKWKNFMVKVSPRFIKHLYYPVNDSIFYREITTELVQPDLNKKYKHPTRPHKYNAYITQWYLKLLEDSL